MSANAENRAWRRSSQQIPPRNQSSSSQHRREDSNSRNNKDNSGNNMVRKAQNPSPVPAQNPWNKGGSGPVKGAAGAPSSQSGTSTPKEKALAVEKAVEQPPTQQQGNSGFNAEDIRKMFDEDAKTALAGLGDDAVVKLPDEGKKQAWGTQRKPGTMANGQSFAAELARQLAELEQNKPSS